MCNEVQSMRNLIAVLRLFMSSVGYAQTIDSTNYRTGLSGTWTLNYCDSLWEIKVGDCVDTLTFQSNGQVNSVCTCERPEGYPVDEEYDTIMLRKEEWTRFDQNAMKLYFKYYKEWDNSWSEELEHYRVISITKDEIRAELYSIPKWIREIPIRVIYTRVK